MMGSACPHPECAQGNLMFEGFFLNKSSPRSWNFSKLYNMYSVNSAAKAAAAQATPFYSCKCPQHCAIMHEHGVIGWLMIFCICTAMRTDAFISHDVHLGVTLDSQESFLLSAPQLSVRLASAGRLTPCEHQM